MSETALSKTGERRLATFEVVIEKGLGTFIEVGGALQAIRDERLYRAEQANFDDYLKVRWNMSRTYAHRLIEATEIAGALPMGNKPTSERAARALAPIKDDPAAMQSAMEAASKATSGRPTAEAITAEVVKHTTKHEAIDAHTTAHHPALALVCKFDEARKAWFNKVATHDPVAVTDAYVHEGQMERVHDFVASLRSFADRMEAQLIQATKVKAV